MEYKLFAVRVFVADWDRAIRLYSETLGMTLRLEVSVPIAFGGALPKLSDHDVNKRVKEGLVDGLALFVEP